MNSAEDNFSSEIKFRFITRSVSNNVNGKKIQP